MDSRRENWTTEELTINNTTSAAFVRHRNVPLSQDISTASVCFVPNNSSAFSGAAEYSQSRSVDFFTRPHFEGSHLTPALTIPTQLPMDNTRESQIMNGSTLNNVTGPNDAPLVHDNSIALALFASDASSTSLSRIYDYSQPPCLSFYPKSDFSGSRLTSSVNILPMDSRRESQTIRESTVNPTEVAHCLPNRPLPSSSRVDDYSLLPGLSSLPQPELSGSSLTSGVHIQPQIPLIDGRENQTVGDSTINNMSTIFRSTYVPFFKDILPRSGCCQQNSVSSSLSRVSECSQSPGTSFPLTSDFRSLTSGANIPSQLPSMEYGGFTEGESTVNNMTSVYYPCIPPSQGISLQDGFIPSTCFVSHSSPASFSRNANYLHSPSMDSLTRPHMRGSYMTPDENRSTYPLPPMDSGRESQIVGESTVNISIPLSRPFSIPAMPPVSLSRRVNAPQVVFHGVHSNESSLSRGGGYSESVKRMHLNRPGSMDVDKSNEVPCFNIPTPSPTLVDPVQTCSNSATSSVSFGEKRKGMSPDWSGQDPKQTKLTSTAVDSSGLNAVISQEHGTHDCSPDPPPLSFNLPKSKDLPKKSRGLQDVELPIDILLLTVEDSEFLACYHYLVEPFKSYQRDIGPVYFGFIGNLKIALLKCSKGSAVPGGSLTVVKNAVRALRPKATVSVGACSGLNPLKTKLGDVIVSSKLTTLSHKSPPSRDFNNLIKHVADGWNPPLIDPNFQEVKIHCNGEVLSRSVAVSKEFIQQHPEAIAVEMEGEGIFAAAHDLNSEWIIIKGIKDYVNSNQSSSDEWRIFASVMAASVVANILSDPVVFQEWPHYSQAYAVNSFNLKTCQRKLAEHYERTAKIPTTVWSSICQVNLDEIYTRLSWVKREETVTGSSLKEMGHYAEMFAEKSRSGAPLKKRILVQGETGIGKTSFVKKMLVDLSNLDEANLDEEQKNAMRRFDLVLAVALKEVSQCQTFTEVLRGSRLFSSGDDKFFNDLNSYIIKNQERVLLVFDGYDEYRTGSKAEEQYGSRSDSPVSQIFHRIILSDCTVMVTTRTSRADELREPADIQAEVTGFNSSDRHDFMTKMLKSETEADELWWFLLWRGMADLLKVPLLNLFFCLLWREEKNELENGTKGKTKLYQAIVRFILQHSHRKHSPTQASMTKEESYEDILAEIGKVALEGLLRGDLVFEYDKLSAAVRGERSVLAGLLQVSECGPSVEPKGMVSFIHKSMQEYLAAWFITNRCVSKGNLGGMEEHAGTLKKCEELENVFLFICGLSDDGAVKILEHLKSVRMSHPELDYSKTIPEKETNKPLPAISYGQWKFIGLVYRCFDEVQSKAKLLDLCLDCFGRVVHVNLHSIEFLREWEVDIQLIHSDVEFHIYVAFTGEFTEEFPDGIFKKCLFSSLLFTEQVENCKRSFIEVFGCGDVVVKVTESATPITLRDFITEYFEVSQCGCSFESILGLHNGRFQFYVTEITLSCDHHAKLFTGRTASCAQSRSRDWSSEQSCLKFLNVLECDILSRDKSFQLFDKFCDLLQSVPNPNRCLLKVGRSRRDDEDRFEFEYAEYRLTTAEAEKLVRALPPFTRIERVALSVSNCSAAAAETLVTSVIRKTVKELDLHGITLTSAVAAALNRSLPQMSSLEELYLTEMDVSNLQAEEVSALSDELLPMMSFLECHFISLRGWPAPLSTIPHYVVNLKLKIYGINTDEDNLVGFFESLRFTPRLKVLSLTCTGCSEQVSVMIESSFVDETLTLAGINLTPAVAAALGRSLPDIPYLRTLYLTGEDEKDVVNMDVGLMEALFGGFEKASPVREFIFSGFSVRGCLAPFTKSLRFFPDLDGLSLTKLNLDEQDLKGLLESFEFIPRLSSLDLSCNPLGDPVRSIVPYVINLSHLHFLLIQETSSDEDLNYVTDAIRHARPDVLV